MEYHQKYNTSMRNPTGVVITSAALFCFVQLLGLPGLCFHHLKSCLPCRNTETPILVLLQQLNCVFSAVVIKRGPVVEADKSFTSQLRLMSLSDGSPYETLHAYVSNAVAPYFKSFVRATGKAVRYVVNFMLSKYITVFIL